MKRQVLDDILGTYGGCVPVLQDAGFQIAEEFRFPADEMNGHLTLVNKKIISANRVYTPKEAEDITGVSQAVFAGLIDKNLVWHVNVDDQGRVPVDGSGQVRMPGNEVLKVIGYGAPLFKKFKNEKGKSKVPSYERYDVETNFGLSSNSIDAAVGRGILHETHVTPGSKRIQFPRITGESLRGLYEAIALAQQRGPIKTEDYSNYFIVYTERGKKKKKFLEDTTGTSKGMKKDTKKFIESLPAGSYDFFACRIPKDSEGAGVLLYASSSLCGGDKIMEALDWAVNLSISRNAYAPSAHYTSSTLLYDGVEMKWFLGGHYVQQIEQTETPIRELGVRIQELDFGNDSRLSDVVGHLKGLRSSRSESFQLEDKRVKENPLLIYFNELFKKFKADYRADKLRRTRYVDLAKAFVSIRD